MQTTILNANDAICGGSWSVRPWACQRGNGVSSLHVDFECDYDEPRPEWWAELPAFLQQAGFELDWEWMVDAEIFAPTTFHSAVAMISATKNYGAPGADEMRRDVERISAFLGRSQFETEYGQN